MKVRTYKLQVSSDVGTRYLTTNSVEELGAVLQQQTTPPIFYEVSEDGDLLFSLMIDGGAAQLSLWRGDDQVCYMQSETPADGSRDLGWQSFPASIVVDDVPGAIAVAVLYADKRELDSRCTWECEDVDD